MQVYFDTLYAYMYVLFEKKKKKNKHIDCMHETFTIFIVNPEIKLKYLL